MSAEDRPNQLNLPIGEWQGHSFTDSCQPLADNAVDRNLEAFHNPQILIQAHNALSVCVNLEQTAAARFGAKCRFEGYRYPKGSIIRYKIEAIAGSDKKPEIMNDDIFWGITTQIGDKLAIISYPQSSLNKNAVNIWDAIILDSVLSVGKVDHQRYSFKNDLIDSLSRINVVELMQLGESDIALPKQALDFQPLAA